MATCDNLIDECLRHLLSGTREQLNRLATGYTAAGTSLRCTYDLDGIKPGAVVGVDLELFYVWDVNESTKTATVTGAHLGSTAANHSQDAIVTVNPRFSRFGLFTALNQDLLDLSSPENGLYRVRTVDLTYNSAIQGYDLTSVTDLLDILEVKRDTSGPSNTWPVIQRSGWDLKRDLPASDFASGLGLILYQHAESGRTIRVSYKAPFGQFTTVADTHTTVGLPDTAVDIPPMGAASRLAFPREIARNFFETQGDTRRAEEVPPSAVGNSMRNLVALRQQRIIAEAARLAQRYPVVKR